MFSGEKIGVEYLYSQTGKRWTSDVTQLDPEEPDDLTEEVSEDPLDDEGFADTDDDPTVPTVLDELQGLEPTSQQQAEAMLTGMSNS